MWGMLCSRAILRQVTDEDEAGADRDLGNASIYLPLQRTRLCEQVSLGHLRDELLAMLFAGKEDPSPMPEAMPKGRLFVER